MGVLGDLNYIKHIQAYPCQIPDGGINIIVEAAFAAAIVGIVTFHTYDCDDILVESLRLGVKGEGPHGLADPRIDGPKGHRGVNIKKASRVTASVRSGNTWLFENVVVPARTIGSGFFVFGIAINAVANFTSMLYAGFNCDQPGLPSFLSGPGGDGFIFIGPRQQEMGTAVAIGAPCCFLGNDPELAIFPGCTGDLSYSFQWGPNPNAPGEATAVTTWIEDDLGYQSQRATWQPDGTNGNGTIGYSRRRPSEPVIGNGLRVMMSMGEGSVQLVKSTFNASCGGRPVHMFPYHNCLKAPAIF